MQKLSLFQESFNLFVIEEKKEISWKHFSLESKYLTNCKFQSRPQKKGGQILW